jgi:GNAT superfamily N-acetyltransferase
MVDLVASHGGAPAPGWWDQIRPHSFGWVTARTEDGLLVGFVNVVGDGGVHAFLLDTKTRGSFQRRGIGTRVVALAARHAQAAGCEWLHVDFEPELRTFYFDACGFEPTDAGLIDLRAPSRAKDSFRNEASSRGCDGRCDRKDAGSANSSPIRATEDAASVPSIAAPRLTASFRNES